ncbi:MAG: rhomboid family intramembrane serine protease [Candidatus Marinimicrobia bacterium]|nr:rhomboid family intramembrane serine protease [Candidatus Neomarinimicrobiota bacterium]
MFPIKDSVAKRYSPIGTWVIVFVNVVIFLFEISLPSADLEQFFSKFALIPARYFGDLKESTGVHGIFAYYPFITNMFLHGGWSHLILNMWSLLIFGPAVEDRLGTCHYLIFYFLVGIAASCAHALVNENSVIPTIGASGAIAGVIGCYVRKFPTSRLVVLVPFFFIPLFYEVPAIVFSFLWFLTQIIPGIINLLIPQDGGGIAWWAHIGGFVAGWILAPLMSQSTQKYRTYYADEGRYGFQPDGRRK